MAEGVSGRLGYEKLPKGQKNSELAEMVKADRKEINAEIRKETPILQRKRALVSIANRFVATGAYLGYGVAVFVNGTHLLDVSCMDVKEAYPALKNALMEYMEANPESDLKVLGKLVSMAANAPARAEAVTESG